MSSEENRTGSESAGGSMSESSRLLGELVEEFTESLQQGQQPKIEGYLTRHPERADELLELLQTIESLHTHASGTSHNLAQSTPMRAIGCYRIDREIGRGGMGVVYSAFDTVLQRQVALKLLPLQATLDERFLQRFQREARAAGKLEHPGIVPVYGVGQEGGVHFYAMQYVEGHSLDLVVPSVLALFDRKKRSAETYAPGSIAALADRLLTRDLTMTSGSAGEPVIEATQSSERGSGASRATGAPVEEAPSKSAPTLSIYARNAAFLALQTAEALAYAHLHGVLHRDVKPGNLLLEHGGRVRLTDFGLCKSEGDSQLTMSRDLVGTLRYMAPEQLDGQTDERTDVYGVGVTLYELLALRPAFAESENARLIEHIRHREPQRLARIQPGLPRDIAAIISKAMAKEPSERYATIEALAEDLRAFLEARPIVARPPSALRLLRLAVRRNRGLTATICAALLLLMVATGLYLRSLQLSERERTRETYLASIAAAASSREADLGVARRSLQTAPKEHRDWEWRHLNARLDSSIEIIADRRAQDVDHTQRATALSFSPGRQNLLASNSGGSVLLYELDGARRNWLLETEQSKRAVDMSFVGFNANGSRLVGVNGKSIALWMIPNEITGGSIDELSQPFELSGQSKPSLEREVALDLSCTVGVALAGQDLVALGFRDGTIRIYDFGLNERRRFTAHASWVEGLSTCRDGKTIVSSGKDGRVCHWDVETGAVLSTQLPDPIRAVAVSSDGNYTAAGTYSGKVWLWRTTAAGDPFGAAQAHGAHDAMVSGLEFSPDLRGRSGEPLLASCAHDGRIHLWEHSSGRQGTFHADGLLSNLSFDGQSLVSSSYAGVITRWDTRSVSGFASLDGHIADTWGLRFSRSGNLALSSCRDSTLRLWDTRSGELVRTLFFHTTQGTGCDISPHETLAAATSGTHDLWLWDLATGEVASHSTVADENGKPIGRLSGLLFSRDGQALFLIAPWGQGLTRCVPEGSVSGPWRADAWLAVDQVNAIALSLDGATLYAGGLDGSLTLVDTQTWEPLGRFDAHDASVTSIDCSRDTVFTAGGDDWIKGWTLDGTRLVHQFKNGPSKWSWGIAVDEDGRRLASSSERCVTLWDVERSEIVLQLQGPGRGYSVVDMTLNGEQIVCSSWDGPIRLWDTLTAVERAATMTPADVAAASRQFVDELHARLGGWHAVRTALAFDRELECPPGVEIEAALRAAHVSSGTLAGLAERCRRLLRREGAGPADYRAAWGAAIGITKENNELDDVWHWSGESLYRLGNFRGAVADCETERRRDELLDRRSWDTYAFLAMAHARLGELESATSALEQAELLAATSLLSDVEKAILSEAQGVVAASAEDE